MSKRKFSYAEKINSAKLLAEGLGKHLDELSPVGLNEAYVTNLENQRKTTENLNVQQERLKAELKNTTSSLTKEIRTIDNMVSRGRKLVKIEIPFPLWKEFGIGDVK
jgi:hypothetical protein